MYSSRVTHPLCSISAAMDVTLVLEPQLSTESTCGLHLRHGRAKQRTNESIKHHHRVSTAFHDGLLTEFTLRRGGTPGCSLHSTSLPK